MPNRFYTYLLLTLIVFSGCGGRGLPLAPVKGKVHLPDGTALSGGVVTFVPDANKGNSGPVAWGHLQPDGNFELETTGHHGAVVGWHRVRINPYLSESEQHTVVPDRYRSETSSPLTAEVVAGRENLFEFRLEK